MNPCLHLLLPLLLGASVVSCSSGSSETPKKAAASAGSQTFAQRVSSSHKRMNDPNARSQFDKAAQSSLARGKSSDWLAGRQFKTDRYHAKSYGGTKAYPAKPYDGGKKRSSMGSQSFAQAGKAAPEAGRNFDTSTSSMAGQQAREGSQEFEGGNAIFKTSPNRDALRSQQKNDRPKFIELEENQRKPAYSEEQVRRLLGRS